MYLQVRPTYLSAFLCLPVTTNTNTYVELFTAFLEWGLLAIQQKAGPFIKNKTKYALFWNNSAFHWIREKFRKAPPPFTYQFNPT